MIASVEDLVRCGLRDRRVRTLLDGADWYLVGSRAAGFGDGFSDWDTVLLTLTDVADEDTLAAASDEIFGIARPDPHGAPTLALHSLWRQAHGVDIKILGPQARRRREAAARVEWAFDLRHAVPLHLSGTDGESYRERVGAAFGQLSGVSAVEAYRAFRQSRNEAVATLPRADEAIQAVTAAACVIHAAHFWMLAAGEPHPADKWLLAALGPHADPAVVATMQVVVDLRTSAGERFDAFWRLWEFVDERARNYEIDSSVLAGSPFLKI